MKNIEYDIPIFESNDLADLDLYSKKMATAIKGQIDKFGNPLAFKGIKQNISELDLISNPQSGDIYGVIETNKNYIWNGKEWIIYSDIMELDNYYNKEEINQKIADIQALPVGGTKGQVLTKQSETDGDANWEDIEANEVFVGNEEEAPSSAKIIIEDEDFEESAGLSKSEVCVGAEEPTTGEKVWFRKVKNVFNFYNIQTKYPNAKLNTKSNNSFSITNIGNWAYALLNLNLKPNTIYTLSADVTNSNGAYCGFYINNNIDGCKNGDKSFKSAITFTTDETGVQTVFAYVNRSATTTASTYTVTFNNVQLEQGSKATSYEAYIEPQIFVRNSNGVYEEFTKKSEEVYSTEEQRIGIWNGKKLYRKTIEVDTSSSFTNSTLTKYEHKIANIEKIIKATSTAKTSWGGGWFTDITLAINKFQIRADETYLYIKNDSGSDYKLEYLAVILEYTKTTD